MTVRGTALPAPGPASHKADLRTDPWGKGQVPTMVPAPDTVRHAKPKIRGDLGPTPARAGGQRARAGVSVDGQTDRQTRRRFPMKASRRGRGVKPSREKLQFTLRLKLQILHRMRCTLHELHVQQMCGYKLRVLSLNTYICKYSIFS